MVQSISIIEAIDDLNDDIFLPAIQREFVWDTDQIIRLFDSVMRDYPIGSFLVWRLRGEDASSQIKYRFVKHYIEDSVYPDEPDFEPLSHHNPRVTDAEEDELPNKQRLILDGQQRLTAFNIGLRGTYTEKKKFAQYKKASAWNQKRLYLNIFSDPQKELEDELGLRYEFKFKTSRPEPTENAFWFRVGRILDIDEPHELMELQDDLGLNEYPKDKRFDADNNLRTLYTALTDERIQYHEENTDSQERVLDIFIRTNEGGTPLSKSEILLSMATARWTGGKDPINAREEITNFVDRLNERHQERDFTFNIDFVLKSLLVLSGRPAEYRIANFTNDNLARMKDEWLETDFRESVERALDLVVEYGLNSRSLTSSNALIPIAQYMHHHDPVMSQNKKQGMRTRRRIHYWLTSALLNGTFNSRPDEVLEDARDAIRDSDGEFPLEEIHQRMRGRGKVVGFSEEVVDTLLEETTYRSQKSFLLLSLLYYPEPVQRNITYQRDHIFPKSRLEATKLIDEYGLDRDSAEKIEEIRGKVANLQLLLPEENAEKSDMDFGEWITGLTEEYRERHLIPDDESLYRVENFGEFVSRREELIRNHLTETFSQFG